MIVVGIDVLASLCLGGAKARQAEELLLADSDWQAPLVWRIGFLDRVAELVRDAALDPARAGRIVAEAEALLRHSQHLVESDEVLYLLKRSSCSALDCCFVALARRLEVPLVTDEAAVSKAFPDVAEPPGSYLWRHGTLGSSTILGGLGL